MKIVDITKSPKFAKRLQELAKKRAENKIEYRTVDMESVFDALQKAIARNVFGIWQN